MRVSSGVVAATLRRILDMIASSCPAPAHVIVTVLLLSVVIPQVQGEREGDGGQRQIPIVRSVKAVASASPQIPPWMNGK